MVKNTFDPPVRTSEEKAFTRGRITHELKIYSDFFYAVCTGVKRAELRKNDRDYQVGDILHLMEIHRSSCYSTGEYINATITHIADVSEWMPGYVLLSIKLEWDDSEAVAWLHVDNGIGIPAITRSRNVADSWLSKGWNIQPLYTDPTMTVVPPAIEPDYEVIKAILPTSNPDEYACCIAADMWNACRAAMLKGGTK